jgi:hypothetical protein
MQNHAMARQITLLLSVCLLSCSSGGTESDTGGLETTSNDLLSIADARQTDGPDATSLADVQSDIWPPDGAIPDSASPDALSPDDLSFSDLVQDLVVPPVDALTDASFDAAEPPEITLSDSAGETDMGTPDEVVECLPDCTGLECGDDGCGGDCGECPGYFDECVNGTCVCTPNCPIWYCGDDGCGTPCGPCPAGEVCVLDFCEAESQCGEITYEGCCTGNGTLKWCEEDVIKELDCTAEDAQCGWWYEQAFYGCVDHNDPAPGQEFPYLCPGECDDPCANVECGPHCDVDCGSCALGLTCESGQCVPCSCDGKACGDDGCGGTCGTCNAPATCNDDGQCEVDACDFVDFIGCCVGKTLYYCDFGWSTTVECDTSCGWYADGGWYDCEFSGADPSGEFPLQCNL